MYVIQVFKSFDHIGTLGIDFKEDHNFKTLDKIIVTPFDRIMKFKNGSRVNIVR